MRISLHWLRELVDVPDPEDLPALLTNAGLEVERIEQLGVGLDQVIVARIEASSPHPKADRLSVTEVDAGGRRLQIVCGAKNYRVGDLVPLALPGAVLPGDVRIAETELRGVRSQGMLCSQRELGLAETSAEAGLFILPAGTPGQRLCDALPVVDTIFELNVTPNRSDCLSHLGIAREVAALTGTARRMPAAAEAFAGRSATSLSPPRIEAEDRCGRFEAVPFALTTAGFSAPSPFWLQARLSACGVRPIGLAVDVTNYVMLELGQPLHAYDLDRLTRGLVVRLAKAGEQLTTLDGVERQLVADDLLICDGEQPIGLAGVIGGASTAVGPSTSRIYLEAAHFAPAGIRRSAKRHQLPSEAAHRFERGVDPELGAVALARAVELLQTLLPAGVVGASGLAVGRLPASREVFLGYARAAQLLGLPLRPEEIVARLASVGVLAIAKSAARASSPGQLAPAGGATFRVPSHRPDLVDPADLIAEVGRLEGFAALEPRAPRGTGAPVVTARRDAVSRALRQALTGAGFCETLQLSFSAGPLADAFAPPSAGPAVRLVNPLKQEHGALRRSLLPSLCETARGNLAHLTRDAGVAPSLRLYEIASVYGWPRDDERPVGPASERQTLGLLWHGPRLPLALGNGREPADTRDLRGLLEGVLGAIGQTLRLAAAELPFLHPRSSAELWSGNRRLGVCGEVHPALAKTFDLPKQLLLAELDLSLLDALPNGVQRPVVPKFPAVLRDIALVVAAEVSAEALGACLARAGGALLETSTLFDLYQGPPLAAGEKSLAYSLRFRAPDRTLTDAEVVAQTQAMIEAAAAQHGAKLRA